MVMASDTPDDLLLVYAVGINTEDYPWQHL